MTFWLLLFLISPGDPLAVGQPMPHYSLPDQYGKIHDFEPGLRWVLLSWEKKTSEQANAWLKQKPTGFLDEQGMAYIVEISPMPRIIAEKLAKPKMKKYPHLVLIADDAGLRKIYPLKAKMLTLLKLKPDGTVDQVHFINDMVLLEAMVTTK